MGSLRGTFLLSIVAAYVVVAVGTFFAFSWSARGVSERYAARFCAAQGELERDRVLSLVDRELALSRKLADDPQIVAWMEAEHDPVRRSAALAQLESYRRFLRDGAWFLAIESSGSYYAKTPETPEPERTTLSVDRAGDRWFYNALKAGRDYSLNVDHNAMLNENRVWINVLVRDRQGRAIGLAGCGMNLTAFLDKLVAHEDPGITTIIVDSAGALQAYRNQDMIAHNAEVKRDSDKLDVYGLLSAERDRVLLKAAIGEAAKGGSPGILRLGMGGTRRICAVSAFPELGWYGLVFVESGRIIGLVDFLPIGAVTIVSLLAVLGCVILAMNALVVGPIARLTLAAGEIAGGAYEIVLPDAERNEIGRLSSSFNTMAKKVKEYTEGLERQVAERTSELRKSNDALAASQKRIVDSINYARLIQESIFPSRAEIAAAAGFGLADHVVLSWPRDEVGGDFVFFKAMPDGFCFAVADCTGHGVPGAFMTMMVKAHLERVVESGEDLGPARMMAELDRLVQESLKKETELAHFENGLDLALCRYRAPSRRLEFAGAGLPLWVAKDGAPEEIEGGRGGLGFSGPRHPRSWAEHVVDAAGGLSVWMVSDGVLDLPGGTEGHGFGRTRLLDLLGRLSSGPMREAGQAAAAAFETWRGERARRDDLTFAGFRISGPGED
jgi:serine phosphatase RsbU (regulator of sigma subunit)